RVAPAETLRKSYEDRRKSLEIEISGREAAEKKSAAPVISPESKSPEDHPESKAQASVEILPDWAATLISPKQQARARRGGVPVARELDLGGGATLKLLLVPPGTFVMSDVDGSPTRTATLTRPFYLGVGEVTLEEYRAVMGRWPDGVSPPSGDG